MGGNGSWARKQDRAFHLQQAGFNSVLHYCMALVAREMSVGGSQSSSQQGVSTSQKDHQS